MGREQPIWLVIGSYYPRAGGAEKQAHLVAQRLCREYEVKVWTRRLAGLSSSVLIGGVSVDRLGVTRSQSWFVPWVFLVHLIVRTIRQRKPKAILTFQISGTAMAAGVCGFLRRTPVITKITGEHQVTRLHTPVGRAVDAMTTVWVVPTQRIRDLALQAGVSSERIVLIPNGVDRAVMRPPTREERGAARESLDLTDGEFCFLYVGRAEYIKGIDLLCSAWLQLSRRSPEARLFLVGPDGASQGELTELLAGSRASLVPYTGDIARYYWAADALVMPSRSEGMPNVAVEALECRLPIVASDIPAISSLLRASPGQLESILCKPEVTDLLDGMALAVETWSCRGNGVRQGPRPRHLDIEATTAEYRRLMEACVRRGRRRR